MVLLNRPPLRRRTIVLAAAFLAVLPAAMTAACGDSGRPVAAPRGSVAASRGPVVARFSVPWAHDAAAGSDAVWILGGPVDEASTLTRIDPATNRVTASYRLAGHGGPAIAVGYGSVWVSQHAEDQVFRVDPATGRVIARIRVGLYPEAVHIAFGSVWSGNHHGQSLSRIDPITNRVIAVLPVGDQRALYDGPQTITDDGRYVYVGDSNQNGLTTIDPRTNTVKSQWPTGRDSFCGDLHFAGGHLYSVDNCSHTFYTLDPTDRRIRRAVRDGTGGAVESEAVLKNVLWVAYDRWDPLTSTASKATLQALDPVTGRTLRSVPVGGGVRSVRALFGDLWVEDATNNVVKRVHIA